MVNEHSTLFLRPSSAEYVTVLIPIGTETGGMRAGTTVIAGEYPELSTAVGTSHHAFPMFSPFAASILRFCGQLITGGVMSKIVKFKTVIK